jgi:predicted transport protein
VISNSVEWSAPRLLCIASDFTRYDEHAVQQINRNIELIRYRRYGGELILFELVNAATSTAQSDIAISSSDNGQKHKGIIQYKTAPELLEQSPSDVQDRFEALKAFLLALGDDVQLKVLKYYFAFRRIKNFACVEVHPQTKRILLFVKVDPNSITPEPGFTRDVHNVGHYGTGDLEITIQTDEDLERAKPLVLKSYEAS